MSEENSTMVPCIYTNVSYCDPEPGAAEKVAKVFRSLYGLKNAPRLWWLGVGVIFVSHALAYYNFPREDKSGSLFEIYPENSKTISEIEFVD